jgi:tetratricopeptide (TPR) repeat protein
VDRKKHSPSGAPPAGPRDGGAGIDDAWSGLSDSDLVELGDAGDGQGHPAQQEQPPGYIPDLPAPVGPTPTRGAGRGEQNTLTDLPVPVGPVPRRSIPDLLTPVGPTPTRKPAPSRDAPPVQRATPPPSAAPPQRTTPPASTSPSHRRPASVSTAPVPPRGPSPSTQAPARRATPSTSMAPPGGFGRTALPDEIDLPAPVGPIPTKQLPDLMTPVGPTSLRSSVDLPAPKGFFDDGVQPKHQPGGSSDLPAPKGFFDDGVQPRPNSATGLPAPKGFFDDGVQPLHGPQAGSQPIDGNFLELTEGPSRVMVSPIGEPTLEEGALLTLDLTGPTPAPSGASAGVNRPFGLDAADLDLERPEDITPPPLPLELNDSPRSGTGPIPRSRTSRMEIGLSGASEHPGPPPSRQTGQVITFGKSSTIPPPVMEKGRLPPAEDPFAPTRLAGHLLTTEIRLELDGGAGGAGVQQLPAALRPKRAPVMPAADARRAPRQATGRRSLLLLMTLIAIGLLTGAYFAWNWWQGQRAHSARATTGIRQIEKLLGEDAPSHWEQAASEARRVTDGEGGQDLEALGVVAEASFASALDESPQAAERIKEGDQALASLRARSARGPHAGKAEALRAILSTNFADAIRRLEELKMLKPDDGNTLLYLGWAQTAQERHGAAAASFTAALTRSKRRIPALYGLGLSQLELGDKQAAAKSFQAVIDESRDRFKRDHLGALIGLAQLAPVSERASRYQELLARPDLAAAPARAVSRLRALAGDEALRGGRLDQARARYEEARALDPLNLRAVIGLALVDVRGGNISGARVKLTEDVLAAAPDHIEGALALIEVALAAEKPDEAMALAQELFARRPSITSSVLLGRAHLARGRVYAASTDPEWQVKAEAELREAMSRSDPGDFAATVALSMLLTRSDRRQEAVELLGPVRAAAREDPGLALGLGSAYLAAGQAEVAAETFRSVLALRPDDAEARFQLANAYLAQGKFEDAIESLRRAYDADASREDIGLALARTLEVSGRRDAAIAAYRKMLDGERKPSVSVRAQAGRTFARLGMAGEADAQGEAIRLIDPRNATGHFLLGEKLFREGDFEDALGEYREATTVEGEAQFLEGLGRVNEKLGKYDDALLAYGDAIAADPMTLAPRLGRGRVRLARREYSLAVGELELALKVAPNDAAVMRDLGRAYFAMRDLRQAVPMLERSVALDARNAETHYALGIVYHEVGRAGEAAKHLSAAVELAPPDAAWRGNAFRQLGYAERANHNRNGAISAWRRYLGIERREGAERREVQRMLMRLEAGGR